jgi:NAD(P)H-dependent FMN reductase
LNLLGICGSLRSRSSNLAILHGATGFLPPAATMTITEALADLPAFNPDNDLDPPPVAVQKFRDAIAAADALVICSPEYAHGMPGVLKNALDWLVSWPGAVNKIVLLISASPGGAVHSHAQLLEVLRTMNLRVVDAGAHVFSQSAVGETGLIANVGLTEALQSALAKVDALARGNA